MSANTNKKNINIFEKYDDVIKTFKKLISRKVKQTCGWGDKLAPKKYQDKYYHNAKIDECRLPFTYLLSSKLFARLASWKKE